MSTMFRKQELYGGNITTVIPEGFIDVSTLREVPDTQEVFVNSRKPAESFDDGLGLNESIIIDLLQRVDESDDRKALDIHLSEVSSLNGSNSWHVIRYKLKGNVQRCAVVDSVLKWGKKDCRDTVVVFVGLIRLQHVETDVLITVNCPVEDEEERLQLQRAIENADVSCAIPSRLDACYRLLDEMVAQFNVVDESLFV
ncbi:HFL293Cp [Eremothecium sinecaudum]|uniref:HFL293Cp n=1 Tax=Eremothecium sinecaudum TaxID=45286 RepID=A0A0X8HUB9_9SACH|nr:HFL293Cp [Eremothecium sinecaudum]AMD21563.1 HFL293Cp [Eremothecium sinecaudum]